MDVCKEAGIDIVRRSTGGRAVLHDEEVTYSVIAPLNSGVFGNTVLDCYRVISEVLQKCFLHLDLPAELVPGKPKGGQKNVAKAVCFSAPSQYELVIKGCKVAGSAQKRHGRAFLQHGSIPLEVDLNLLGRALRADSNKDVAESLATVGWLNRYSNKALNADEVEKTLTRVFADHLGITIQESVPTGKELEMADHFFAEKFASDDWNFRR
jgi:lipoate-protein ligase A